MYPFPLFKIARLSLEAQWVVALRLARIAGGGALGQREANRMVIEKTAAVIEAQMAAAAALMTGRSPKIAAKRAFGTYGRAVRANRRRLSRPRRRG